jgi:hypothetical protein
MTSISRAVSAARALARRLPGDDRKNADAVVGDFAEVLQRLDAAEADIRKLSEGVSQQTFSDSLS